MSHHKPQSRRRALCRNGDGNPPHARGRCKSCQDSGILTGEIQPPPHTGRLPIPAPVAFPGWMDAAACLRTNPEVFFPATETPESVAEAKTVCATCPVRRECLAWAWLIGADRGVFGGTTGEERLRILRPARSA